MKPRILLINPPIYDFTAYDFWVKPLGLLTAAAPLNPFAELHLYDFLDRLAPLATTRSDRFNRGPFPSETIGKPPQLAHIPRRYHRFGLPQSDFRTFLATTPHFNHALIQTTMTYWYPGIREVITDLRNQNPDITVVLGGFYAQSCPDHATTLGADLVLSTPDNLPLYNLLKIGSDAPKTAIPPLYNLYPKLKSAAIKLTTGCPFKCTYCWSGQHAHKFTPRPIDHCITELHLLLAQGVTDIAFYDDALLCQPETTLIPFLMHIIDNNISVNLHTPNALHAGLLTKDLAQLMARAGFKTFYLGFESSSADFHSETGAKVSAPQLQSAVKNLLNAGIDRTYITAYQIIGHPKSDLQELEESMKFANSLGIRIMLADFSPIPQTPDGELCRRWIDLDEPLNHNKTAFPITSMGVDKVNHFKQLRHTLNRSLPATRA